MEKFNSEIIKIIVTLISSFLLLVFAICMYFNLNFNNSLVNNFHKQIKNEHLKIEKLSKEIEKHPDYYALYLERADAKFKKQEYFSDFVKIFYPFNEYTLVQASDITYDLYKAEELNPNVDINLTLGIIEYKQKEYESAIVLLTNYINANQKKDDVYLAYYYRALSYDNIDFKSNIGQQAKNVNNAIRDLNTSIALKPNFSKSYTALANIYDEKEKSFPYYDKAISINNTDTENHLRKILEHVYRGNNDKNLIISGYYDALNTDKGKWCSLLYWSMCMNNNIDLKLKMEMAHNHFKTSKILAKAIKNCKYCVIPNEYSEDIKHIQ